MPRSPIKWVAKKWAKWGEEGADKPFYKRKQVMIPMGIGAGIGAAAYGINRYRRYRSRKSPRTSPQITSGVSEFAQENLPRRQFYSMFNV